MTPNSNSVKIFVQCSYSQVSSSYVYSFRSYHVDTQSHPQTTKQTDATVKTSNVLCYDTTLGNKPAHKHHWSCTRLEESKRCRWLARQQHHQHTLCTTHQLSFRPFSAELPVTTNKNNKLKMTVIWLAQLTGHWHLRYSSEKQKPAFSFSHRLIFRRPSSRFLRVVALYKPFGIYLTICQTCCQQPFQWSQYCVVESWEAGSNDVQTLDQWGFCWSADGIMNVWYSRVSRNPAKQISSRFLGDFWKTF